MLPANHRQVLLSARPSGIPLAEQFRIVEAPLPEIRPGEFLVRNEFLSVEPAMRGWVNATANYSDPVPMGGVMRSFAADTVIASRHPGFLEGERVMGMLGWQEYSVSDGRNIRRTVGITPTPAIVPALLRRHPDRAIEANHLTVQHRVGHNVLHQLGELIRLAETIGKWHLSAQRVLRLLR